MEPARKLTEIKREQIIEAAVAEFKTNGYRATSMDSIAATAQVSKRTVYNHFESKEQLFQVITQELFDRVIKVSERAYEPGVPVRKQLKTIAEQEMALLTSEEFLGLARVITSESLSSPELTRTNFDEVQESAIGVVRWIKEAAADGKLKVSDPVSSGKRFLALIEAFAFWPQLFSYKPVPSRKEQESIIESAIEMFLNTHAV